MTNADKYTTVVLGKKRFVIWAGRRESDNIPILVMNPVSSDRLPGQLPKDREIAEGAVVIEFHSSLAVQELARKLAPLKDIPMQDAFLQMAEIEDERIRSEVLPPDAGSHDQGNGEP